MTDNEQKKILWRFQSIFERAFSMNFNDNIDQHNLYSRHSLCIDILKVYFSIFTIIGNQTIKGLVNVLQILNVKERDNVNVSKEINGWWRQISSK